MTNEQARWAAEKLRQVLRQVADAMASQAALMHAEADELLRVSHALRG